MSGNNGAVPGINGCAHEATVTVITAGLEHVVCENCGDVTIRYESAIAGDIRRSQFAREADALATTRKKKLAEAL